MTAQAYLFVYMHILHVTLNSMVIPVAARYGLQPPGLMPYSTLGGTEVHFYRNTCPQVEFLVRSVVQKWFFNDTSIPGGLLRLQFHDCFIRGCDASVLIDSFEDNVAEKEAIPNLTLRGFELIDEIKSLLEKKCKGIVSCADILALATRDGVALSGGPAYPVPTGRRDGVISKIEQVILPGPTFSIDAALNAFKAIGLDMTDMVTLLGAHTIGFSHCGFFSDRLYDFQGTGLSDPSMSPSLVQTLKKTCPPPNEINDIRKDPKVFLDQGKGSSFSFDNSFYHQLLNNEAILQIDQELAFTDVTADLATTYATNFNDFKFAFADSITKMGDIAVLTGKQGEIRANCRIINSNNRSLRKRKPGKPPAEDP
eukprot:Gb_28303 [translate_table: standard]